MANASLNVLDAPGGSAPSEVDQCVWETRQQHELIPTLLCSICLSVGLVYCLLGYRCFKMVMFLSGFMLGSAVVCLLSVVQRDSALTPESELGLETKAGISLGVGVLCGLLTMLLSTLGLFLTGLQLGAVLSAAALLAVTQFLPSSLLAAPWWWWWMPLTALLAASVLCALLTLCWQKPLTVVSTGVCGAVAVALSVDYLVEASPLVVQVCDVVSGGAVRPLCWFTWALLGTAPALGLAGVLVQWRVTASGISHTQSAYFLQKQDPTKALSSGSQFRRSQRRASSRRRRRRGPTPLQRYAGDVLAPSYIQSLQERQIGTASSSGSSRSNITCTVVDVDFETRSMAPLTASAPPAFRL